MLSCLVFHHLRREEKRVALAECHRILRPGGELHVADWARPANRLLRGGFFLTQLLDGFETTGDNVRGLLPELALQAGFEAVEETRHFPTAFGSIRLLRANCPSKCTEGRPRLTDTLQWLFQMRQSNAAPEHPSASECWI